MKTEPKKAGMFFKAKNGKVYRLIRDEYVSAASNRTIFQTAFGWFYPENIDCWCISLGVGSVVKTPDGETVKVSHIFPNGTIGGGRSTACSNGKSYQEYDLQLLAL